MKFGIGPFTTQLPEDDPRTPGERYRESIGLAKKAEEEGFDSVWVSQHHRANDNYLSSPFTITSAMAEATSDITIGVGVALAPFYDPLLLAEDAAAVDAISDGRFELGLAIGYHDPEFEQFGVSKSERVPRLIDCVNVCRRAWSGGSFSYDGHTVSYEDAIVNPTPPQGDDLPIVVGGLSEPAIRRCADLGDGYIGGLTSPFEEIEGIVEMLDDAGADVEEFPIHVLRDGFIGDDKEDAWERMREGLMYTQNIYAKWFAESSDFNDMDEPDDPEAAFKEFSVYGGPEDLREEVQRYGELLNENSHFIMRLEYPTLDFEESANAIERFSDEVIEPLK